MKDEKGGEEKSKKKKIKIKMREGGSEWEDYTPMSS